MPLPNAMTKLHDSGGRLPMVTRGMGLPAEELYDLQADLNEVVYLAGQADPWRNLEARQKRALALTWGQGSPILKMAERCCLTADHASLSKRV
jgi:hypothetical protein